MKIKNPDLLQKAVARADDLQRQLDAARSPERIAENEHYREACRKADELEQRGSLLPPINSDPDSAYTMVREADSPKHNDANEFQRRRIARLATRDPQAAVKQLAELDAGEQRQRPMTLSELVQSLQAARVEVRSAVKSGDQKRIEEANRRVRALHRERTRRGTIKVSC
jgi:hypothetical protein